TREHLLHAFDGAHRLLAFRAGFVEQLRRARAALLQRLLARIRLLREIGRRFRFAKLGLARALLTRPRALGQVYALFLRRDVGVDDIDLMVLAFDARADVLVVEHRDRGVRGYDVALAVLHFEDASDNFAAQDALFAFDETGVVRGPVIAAHVYDAGG